MTLNVWVKIAQALVMICGAVGIAITEEMALAIVTGVFAVLSALSAVKAWIENKSAKGGDH